MKVSMTNEKSGLSISVCAQLHHEGSEHGALIPLLAARGGYSEDEALDDLQEILQNSMHHALAQADSTLRIAIEERLLSISVDAHSSRKNSLSDSTKDERPAEKAEPVTTEIIVVHGPADFKKAVSANYLAKLLGAETVVVGQLDSEEIVVGKTTAVVWDDEQLDLYASIVPVLANRFGNISLKFVHSDALPKEFN